METYRVTFIVQTDEDPSSILDAANETLSTLVDNIESSGSRCTADEDDIAVELIE